MRVPVRNPLDPIMTAFDVAAALSCALVPVLVCAAAGSAVGRGATRLPGADMLVGAGLASGVLTLLAVATRVPLSILMLAIAGFAVLAPLVRRKVPGGVAMWIALALVAPLLVRAAATQATLWDEFWHWLPNAAYAYTHDALARRDLPPSFSRWPAYPQAIPLAIAAASFLARRFLEGAGPVMNVALLAAYGALLADTILAVRRREGRATPALTAMALAAGAVVAVLIVNPGLDGEVVLSSYSDPATMVMVGALGLLGVELLARLAGRSAADPAEIAWRFGFVAAALINLKQSNPVLLALMVAGLAVIVRCDRDIRLRRALVLLPQMLGPAAVVYLAWRWYVAANFPAGEAQIHRISTWHFSAMASTFASTLRYVRETPLFYAEMWLVTAAGLAALPTLRRRGEEARWLAVITAIVWLGYNAFLLFVYLAVFTEEEARWAADYWRYTPHVALLALSAPIVALSRFRPPIHVPKGAVALVCAAVALAAPVLRSDLGTTRAKRWPLFVRSVTTDLKSLLPPGAGVVIVLGYQINPYPIIVRYDLWQLGDPARTIQTAILWQGADLAEADGLVAHGQVQYLILHDRAGSDRRDGRAPRRAAAQGRAGSVRAPERPLGEDEILADHAAGAGRGWVRPRYPAPARFRLPPGAPVRCRTRTAVAHLRPRATSSSSAEKWCDRATRGSAPMEASAPPALRPKFCAVAPAPCQGRDGRWG